MCRKGHRFSRTVPNPSVYCPRAMGLPFHEPFVPLVPPPRSVLSFAKPGFVLHGVRGQFKQGKRGGLCCTKAVCRHIGAKGGIAAQSRPQLLNSRVSVRVSFGNKPNEVSQVLGGPRHLPHWEGVWQAFFVLARTVLASELGFGTCPLLPVWAVLTSKAGVHAMGRTLDDLPHVVNVTGGFGIAPVVTIHAAGKLVGRVNGQRLGIPNVRIGSGWDPLAILSRHAWGDVNGLHRMRSQASAPVQVDLDNAML